MAHEYVFGLLGPICTAQARKTWNELLRKQQVDGFFDFYRTLNKHDLVTRLSEMFLLERRGYIIADSLQQDAVSLMDTLDASVTSGRVDTVKNERGVLVGYFLGNNPEKVLALWMA